jgi:AraC-like DNA-binding protein
MNLTLFLPDIFLYTSLTVLLFAIIVLLRKLNFKNFMIVGSLVIYFSLMTVVFFILLFLNFNQLKRKTIAIMLIWGIVIILHNVFHYFSLQLLITKNKRFKAKYLLHLIPVLFFLILFFFDFETFYSLKENGYSFIYETQHLTFTQNTNYSMSILRFLHPIVYLVLGGYLVYSFYISPQYLSTFKQTRIFILLFYFQKIFWFFWLILGFIGFKFDLNLYSTISMFGFSLTALFMSGYLLLNLDLLLQNTKPIFNTKSTEGEQSKLTDLSLQLSCLMNQEKLFLDHSYNLTNLSSDSDMSANTIRKVIAANGFKNYSAYINSFRITYAENLILNGYLKTFSIESLCKDSGFQSEVTFYRVFKKIHHCTPKEYSYVSKTNG